MNQPNDLERRIKINECRADISRLREYLGDARRDMERQKERVERFQRTLILEIDYFREQFPDETL